MKWIKGKPNKEGKYLTIKEYNINGTITFSDPIVCKFCFCRYRITGELVYGDEGIDTCWERNGTAELVDYYMNIPKNPSNKQEVK